jgi:hypothetical protein
MVLKPFLGKAGIDVESMTQHDIYMFECIAERKNPIFALVAVALSAAVSSKRGIAWETPAKDDQSAEILNNK